MSRDKDVKCELCNVSTPTIVDQIEHDASLMHHMKVDHQHNGNWTHICGICNHSTGTLKAYLNHLKGKKHELNTIKNKPKWTSKSSFKIPPTFMLPKQNNNKVERAGSTSNAKESQSSPSKLGPKITDFRNTPDISNFNNAEKNGRNQSDYTANNQAWMNDQNYTNQPWVNQGPAWNMQNYHQNQGYWNNEWPQHHQYNNHQNSAWNYNQQWYPNTFNGWGIQSNYNQQTFGSRIDSQNFNGLLPTPMQNASKVNKLHHGASKFNVSQSFNDPSNKKPSKFNNPPKKFNASPQKINQQNKFNITSNNRHNLKEVPVANNEFQGRVPSKTLNESKRPSSRESNSSSSRNKSRERSSSHNRSKEDKDHDRDDSRSKSRESSSSYNRRKEDNDQDSSRNSRGAKEKEKPPLSNSKFEVRARSPDNTRNTSGKSKTTSTDKNITTDKVESSSKPTQEDTKKERSNVSGSNKSKGAQKSQTLKKKKVKGSKKDTNGGKKTLPASEKDGDKQASKNKSNKESSKETNSDSGTTDGSTLHLFFLSSDSDGEGDPASSSKKKDKSEKGPKHFNKMLINRLVNHPCTPRQQLQLTRWLQSQNQARSVSMPRFNLPLNEDENAIENVMNELPDDILTTLYRAIENDDPNGTEPEMEVCLKTEAIDENSGNIPWADFLKSLEENGNILDPNKRNDETSNITNNEDVLPSSSEQQVTIKEEPNNEETEPIAPTQDATLEATVVEPTGTQSQSTGDINNDAQSVQIKSEPTDVELPSGNLDNSGTMREVDQSQSRSVNAPSERGTPCSVRRAPSIGSVNISDPISFEQSQKEVTEWINRLNTEIPECITIPTTPPPRSNTGGSETIRENSAKTIVVPSKDIVDELLHLNSEEESLRDQSQKVEQVIRQLYRLLEEWKMKRSEIILQETNFRNKRMKLLENLKGAFQTGNPNQVKVNTEVTPGSQPSTSEADKIPYLGTLESTLNFVNELGTDMGLNIANPQVSSTNLAEEEESFQTPDSSNWESSLPSAKKPTKTKKAKKKKDSSNVPEIPIPTIYNKNGKSKASSPVELTKKKKRKRKSETEISSTSPGEKKRKKSLSKNDAEPSQEELEQATMMRDYMSTVMPQHIGNEISDPSITSLTSEIKPDITPVLIVEAANSSEIIVEEEIFAPLKIHENAIIDVKVTKDHLFSCSSDKTAKRINLKNRSQIVTYKGHERTVSSIQVYECRQSKITQVYTSCHDHHLRRFDADTGICVEKIDLSSSIVSTTLNWDMLFLGLQNGKIVPYDINNSKLLKPILGSDEVSISYICAASEGCQRLLFIVDYNGFVTVRNAMTGLFIRSLEGTVKPPCRITVHSSQVYITTMSKTVLIYDLMSGALQRKITSESSSATGIAFYEDKAICCYLDGTIKCYNKDTWKQICIFYNPEKPMTMCMIIKNDWIFTGNRFGSIQGFKLDFSKMKPCKYQRCCFPPFGRESDLKRHIDDHHLNRSDVKHMKTCPWQSCAVDLSSSSLLIKKSHIICHASKECY